MNENGRQDMCAPLSTVSPYKLLSIYRPENCLSFPTQKRQSISQHDESCMVRSEADLIEYETNLSSNAIWIIFVNDNGYLKNIYCIQSGLVLILTTGMHIMSTGNNAYEMVMYTMLDALNPL